MSEVKKPFKDDVPHGIPGTNAAEIDELQVAVGVIAERLDDEVLTRHNEIIHFYANGSTGDDANDGLTEQTPKKSFAGLMSIKNVDRAEKAVIHHLQGIFSGNIVSLFSCR